MKWVKQSKYCELTGETPGSVKSKRRVGHFIDGVHCKVAPDGNMWINLEEVQKWIENGNAATVATLSCHAA
jgi:hypothetical protein